MNDVVEGTPRRALVWVELGLLAAWTLFVTAPLFDFDATSILAGREYLSSIASHHIWTHWQTCGACALWNGSLRGGAPAFVDVYGSWLHPLVIVTTLLAGVINGSKLALLGAFGLAGLAQWRLARLLGLGPLSRLWSAALAITAGNLAGRLEIGVFGVVLSTAAGALVLPELIALNQTPTRRAAAGLGITLALALIAGQGYLQIGLGLILPAALFLLPDEPATRALIFRRYAFAGVLALLLAAPLLVPFAHFLPAFVKDVDVYFGGAQPFAYIPLNLVIADASFYLSETLGKISFPYLYINYIGWAPVLLAVWGCFGALAENRRRVVRFLIAWSGLAFWIASADPFRVLAQLAPTTWLAEQLVGIRNPALIAGLAIPAILGLAALGLERLLNELPQVRLLAERTWVLDTALLVVLPLTLALADAHHFNAGWIKMAKLEPEIFELLHALQTPDLQWTNPPYGEHVYIEPGIGMGLKMSYGIRAWNWRDHDAPPPAREASLRGEPPGMARDPQAGILPIYTAAGREYAAVAHADGARTVCAARGIGGDIDVTCDTAQPGVLTVRENNWEGWSAQVNGQTLRWLPGQWLAIELPPGKQTIQLRYRPWDVPLGFLLCSAGIFLAAFAFFKNDAVGAR